MTKWEPKSLIQKFELFEIGLLELIWSLPACGRQGIWLLGFEECDLFHSAILSGERV